MRPTRFAPIRFGPTHFARCRMILPVAALLALSACDWFGGTPQEAADASGEVLPASVSDEMIATQDLKSQPPALRVQPGEAGVAGADSADSAAADSGVAVEEPAAEAEPAAAE